MQYGEPQISTLLSFVAVFSLVHRNTSRVPLPHEKDLSLPHPHPFRVLKEAFLNVPGLSDEVAKSMQVILERHNPSSAAERFTFGACYEWIMATAAWVAGIRVIPAGHSQNGFDLMEYGVELAGLWSIKSSGTKKLGTVNLVNKRKSKKQPTTSHYQNYLYPTLFISPGLPGITLFEPSLALGFAQEISYDDDATSLKGNFILEYATNNPEFVIPFNAPINQKKSEGDQYIPIVTNLLTSGGYPQLSIIRELTQVSERVKVYRDMLNKGDIPRQQFDEFLKTIDKNL